MSGHIWMEHGEHGGRAQLPDIPYWRARGWEPCDGPPPEPDLTRDPEPDAEPAQETTEPPESPGVSAVQPVTAESAEETEENDRG
jgi:hypothetical protein